MKMKRIIFVITSFRHGGINKSLENLLSLIDTEKYEVDIFAMEHYGPYKEMLPNSTILPEEKWLSGLLSHYTDTSGLFRLRSLATKILRIIGSKFNFDFTNTLFRIKANNLNKQKKYDVVIAFSEGSPTAFLSHVNHKNKIAWIHCDYNSYMKLNNNPDEDKVYKTFKSIVCVSDYTKDEFCRKLPQYERNTFSLHNVLNLFDIELKSNTPVEDARFVKNDFTILTIGSFYPIKRLSFIPDIANELIKRGCSFKWYIIANVNNIEEYNRFNNLIFENGLEKIVVFLGEKKNPYPFLKKSDLFVSLSQTEACPYVINESKALKIPIVCTDFLSAPEFVEDGFIGFIAPIEKIADKIELLIKNDHEYKRLKINSNKNKYDNALLMSKFYNIIN
jgi:glycosyltransferase involved in cell wall biosynthesis